MNSSSSRETNTCLNCGNTLKGQYCEICGQKKFEMKDRSIKSFVIHFTEEFFTFDSKFLRTVKHLLFKPGYLTLEYISGRHIRYVTPLKLYLFTSLITLFVMISLDSDQYTAFMEPREKGDIFQNMINPVMESKEMPEAKFRENFNETINGNTAVSIFFMMFTFSIVLKLCYVYKNIYYVEHLVFTLHFFTMVLIFLTIGSLIGTLSEDLFYPFMYLFPAVYLMIAIKRVYHIKWLSAIIPGVFLSFIYLALLFIWVIMLTYLSALMA